MEPVIISVIIPIYNGEKFLEKCVRSLFEQTITNIEFIFVNDCTQDRSVFLLKKLIKAYPERKPFFKTIHHKQNRGVASARNTGIKNALGKYLFFIDQDDYLDNDALEIFYTEAKKENADIVYSNHLYQYRYHHHICKNRAIVNKQSYLIEMLKLNVSIELWSRLYKKELFDLNTLRFPKKTSGADDLAIVPVLFYYANKIKYINFAPYHYVRYNSQAVTQKKMKKNRLQAIVFAVGYLDFFFKGKEDMYISALEWTKFHIKMYSITHTRGELQRYAYSFFSEIDIKPSSIKEKLMYYMTKRKIFTFLNFVFGVKGFFSYLRKYMFFL